MINATNNLTNVISRRAFLKQSALAATAVTASKLDVARSAHAAGPGTIKLGLIGCGGRGCGAASDALSGDPETKLWGMADVFPDKIDAGVKNLSHEFKERIDVEPARRFSGLDGYKGVIDSCDVVLIACASRFHPQYGMAAVKAKKHVFIEKPAGIDIAGVHQVLEANELAKKNGTGLLAGLTYRYHLGRREAIKRIRNGEIGDILAIQCEYMRAPYRLIERDPKWSEMEYQIRNWYHFSWLSGDDVPQSLIHNLDSALWALGDELPELAYGMGGRSTHFTCEMGTSFDHNSVTYEYPDGRRIFGSCRTAVGCFNDNKDIIHGTKGRCMFKSFKEPVFMDLKGNVTWKAEPLPPKTSPYKQEHMEFLKSIRDGKPMQSGKQLAMSTMATVLGQLAIYSGQKITWEDAFNSKFAFPPSGEIRMDMQPPVKPGPDGVYPVAIPGQTKYINPSVKKS